MPKKHFFRSNVIYNQPDVNVDRENGSIKGVVIAQFGLNKNGTFFSDRFLNELMEYGNNAKNGIKARFGHPNMCSTSLGSFIGRYSNFRIENQKLIGDLALDDIAKKTKVEGRDISMFEWVFDMAENNPDVFGNSIHFISEDIDEVFEENGKRQKATGHILTEWIASDVVDDPAATESLFYGVDDLGTQLTGFLDSNPEIFQAIDKQPEIIADFFERYENYFNRKNQNTNNKMSITKRIRKMLGQTYDIDMTLANGDIVTVITEAEEPAVGDQVVDAEGSPLEDDEHLLPNGGALVTENGVITEIKDPEEEPSDDENDEEPPLSEVMQSVKSLSKKFDSMIAKLNKFQMNQKDSDAGLEMIAKQVGQLDKKFQQLAKGVGSEYETFEEGEEGNNPNGARKSKFSTAEDLKARRKEFNGKNK